VARKEAAAAESQNARRLWEVCRPQCQFCAHERLYRLRGHSVHRAGFSAESEPVWFHEDCRKRLNEQGQPDPEGTPVPETELQDW